MSHQWPNLDATLFFTLKLKTHNIGWSRKGDFARKWSNNYDVHEDVLLY